MSLEMILAMILSWLLGYVAAVAVQRIRGRRYHYYEHRKGGTYRLIGHGLHTETGEELVAYESVEGERLWLRPLELFYDGRFTEVPRP